jgi:hypothetical protein
MALFSKVPEKNLTRDRDAAKANVDRLAFKLNEAEASVIATKSAAQRAAFDGDDAGLDLAEAAERAALHRHGTLSAAHTQAAKLVAVLESQIAELNDKKMRTATAAAANALADELIEAGAAYDASTAILAEVSTRALAVSFEANGLAVFTASSRIEVAAAIPVVAEVLRQHGRAVVNGIAPAKFPTPAPPPADVVPPPVAVAPVAEPVKAVFRRADRPNYVMKIAANR